jgi:hypothetical protein
MNTRIANLPSWLLTPSRHALEVARAAVALEHDARPNRLHEMLVASRPYRDADAAVPTVAVHIPMLVHAALTGDAKPAVPLSAALLLLEAGVYALDHVLDAELAPPLDSWGMSEVVLTATSLISYAPQRVLLQLRHTPALLVALQRRLADGLAAMSEGQALDLDSRDRASVTVERIERAIQGKTGERRALYAALAAELAGASPPMVRIYAEYGRCLGIARQIHSDLIDLFVAETSRDLASGVCTLPIAMLLERTADGTRDAMLAVLDAARTDADAAAAVRVLLRERGCLRDALRVKEMHCQKALRVLSMAEPHASAAAALAAAVGEVSLAEP